jgi:hypothetical protein
MTAIITPFLRLDFGDGNGAYTVRLRTEHLVELNDQTLHLLADIDLQRVATTAAQLLASRLAAAEEQRAPGKAPDLNTSQLIEILRALLDMPDDPPRREPASDADEAFAADMTARLSTADNAGPDEAAPARAAP